MHQARHKSTLALCLCAKQLTVKVLASTLAVLSGDISHCTNTICGLWAWNPNGTIEEVQQLPSTTCSFSDSTNEFVVAFLLLFESESLDVESVRGSKISQLCSELPWKELKSAVGRGRYIDSLTMF